MPRRPPIQRTPLGIEKAYGARLIAIAAQARSLIDVVVMPQLERLEQLAGIRTDARRADAAPWESALLSLMVTVRQRMAQELDIDSLERLAATTGEATAEFNKEEMTRQLRASIGVDIFLADPTLVATVAEFTTANVAWIKTIPAKYFADVEQIINRGFRKGQRAASMAPEIEARFGVSARRARFIARDQIGSLNGQLTESRQTELGLDEYIWCTSRDERVRESHMAMEGTTQKWSEPPTVGDRSVHPGEDYNCRCTAEPKIPGVAAIKTSPKDVKRDPELVANLRRREARRARRILAT